MMSRLHYLSLVKLPVNQSVLLVLAGAALGAGQAVEQSLLVAPMLLLWIALLEHPLLTLIVLISLILVPVIFEGIRYVMSRFFWLLGLLLWLLFVFTLSKAALLSGFGIWLLIIVLFVVAAIFFPKLGPLHLKFQEKLHNAFKNTSRQLNAFTIVTLPFLSLFLAISLLNEIEVDVDLVRAGSDGVEETRIVPYSGSISTPMKLIANIKSAPLGRDKYLLFGYDRSFVWDGESRKAADAEKAEKSGSWVNFNIAVAGRYAWVAGRWLRGDSPMADDAPNANDPPDLWVYEPTNWDSGRLGALQVRRRDFQMISLDKNQVLVVGGRRLPLTNQSPASQGIRDVELVCWSESGDIKVERLPDMLTGRWRHRLVRLHDGRVMAVGGHTTRAEIFDPRTRRWSDAGSYRDTNEKEASTDLNVLALPDGRAAIVGNPLRLWDPASRRWQAVVLNVFPGHQSVVMGDGSIFSLNGRLSTVLDTQTYKIRPGPTLKNQRENPALAALSNGKVHVIGGTIDDGKKILNNVEIVRVARVPEETGPLEAPVAYTATTKLKDGRVLLAGNWGVDGEDPRKSEIIEIGATEILPPRKRHERKSLGPIPATFLMQDGSVVVVGGDPVVAQRWSANTGKWSLVPGPELALSPVHGRDQKLEDIVQRANGTLVTFNATHQTDRTNETRVRQWDPVTDKVQVLAPMHKYRTGFSAIELVDGRVAVGGGWEIAEYIALDNDCINCRDEFVPIGDWKNAITTELYDFNSNRWTAGPESRHAGGTIARLPDGRAVKVSSIKDEQCARVALEVADVGFTRWNSVTCPTGNIDASHVVVLGNRVLLVGSELSPENPVPIWNAKENRWTEWRPDRYLYIQKIQALDEWRFFVLGSVGDRRIYTTMTVP